MHGAKKCLTKKAAFVLHFVFFVATVVAFHPSSGIVPPKSFSKFTLKAGLGDNEIKYRWLKHGLLLSSFTEGLKPNADAVDFLMRGLASCLLSREQVAAEDQVAESAVQSPCCGPDLSAIVGLEAADAAIEGLDQGKVSWKSVIQSLAKDKGQPLELRFLYIPTAMYALRRDSTNTPGKQRQRARADGKKRRDEIVKLLSHYLGSEVEIQTVTLDLDDGSIKQPNGSADPSTFPKDGEGALETWKPHFIYVQGGNSFWLHHCIEKGNWGPAILEACTGEDAAVYCGTSAGAIIMGRSMDTACWKGWDDPSVVPGRETYEEWKNIRGFGIVGERSFFPHMDNTWQDLVDEKVSQSDDDAFVICLRDEEACCVDGLKRDVKLLSSFLVPVET